MFEIPFRGGGEGDPQLSMTGGNQDLPALPKAKVPDSALPPTPAMP